jgi:hypothetical protein
VWQHGWGKCTQLNFFPVTPFHTVNLYLLLCHLTTHVMCACNWHGSLLQKRACVVQALDLHLLQRDHEGISTSQRMITIYIHGSHATSAVSAAVCVTGSGYQAHG